MAVSKNLLSGQLCYCGDVVASPKIELRVRPDIRVLWEEAAENEGVSLSAWIKGACEAALDPSVRVSLPPVLEKVDGPVGKVLGGQGCPLVVPRGCRCKLCGRVHRL